MTVVTRRSVYQTAPKTKSEYLPLKQSSSVTVVESLPQLRYVENMTFVTRALFVPMLPVRQSVSGVRPVYDTDRSLGRFASLAQESGHAVNKAVC